MQNKRLLKKIQSLQLTEGTLYICPGDLSPEALEHLQNKLPAGSQVVYDHKEHQYPARSLDHLTGFSLGDPKQFPQILHGLDFRTFRQVTSIYLVSIRPEQRSLIKELEALLLRALARFWKNNATERFFFLSWQGNSLQNGGKNPIQLLGHSPSQVPVVLVGAGVSNQKVLPRLADLRRNYLLIVVDTALGAVLDHGLRPDAVIVLEGQYHNSQDFLPLGKNRLPFIADLSSHPTPPKKWASSVLWTLTKTAPTEWHRRLASSAGVASLPPLGNVGNYALAVARRISQGPLFLTGMDYWFPAGQSHAKGTTYFRRIQAKANRLLGPYQNHWEEMLSGLSRSEYGGLSNPAMQTYRRDLLETMRRDQKAFLLQGLAHWPQEINISWNDFEKQLNISRKENATAGEAPPKPPIKPTLESIMMAIPWDSPAFFHSEKKQLRDFLSKAQTQWTKEEMEAMDYLYHHFPDQNALPNHETSFLNRLHESATVVQNLYKKYLA